MLLTFIILSLTVVTIQACNKIACAAIITGCVGLCSCDVVGCACCPECAVCMGTMWKECCDCFNKCGSGNKMFAKYPQLFSLLTSPALRKEITNNSTQTPLPTKCDRSGRGQCMAGGQCYDCGSPSPIPGVLPGTVCCGTYWMVCKTLTCIERCCL